MGDESSSLTPRVDREPIAVTIADLLALVVGVAVVATITWPHPRYLFFFIGPLPPGVPP